MITAKSAAVIRQQALIKMSRELVLGREPIVLPEVEPESPTKWVVMKDANICPPGGSVCLVKQGTIITDVNEMMRLAQNDVELAALE